MVKMGETLMTGVQETDSEASQKIATSYDQIMKDCADEPLKSAVLASVLCSRPRRSESTRRFSRR